jgi:hypothetical protein
MFGAAGRFGYLEKLKKCYEGNRVANYTFPLSSIGIFSSRTSRYGGALFTLSIAKVMAMLPLTSISFPFRCSITALLFDAAGSELLTASSNKAQLNNN